MTDKPLKKRALKEFHAAVDHYLEGLGMGILLREVTIPTDEHGYITDMVLQNIAMSLRVASRMAPNENASMLADMVAFLESQEDLETLISRGKEDNVPSTGVGLLLCCCKNMHCDLTLELPVEEVRALIESRPALYPILAQCRTGPSARHVLIESRAGYALYQAGW